MLNANIEGQYISLFGGPATASLKANLYDDGRKPCAIEGLSPGFRVSRLVLRRECETGVGEALTDVCVDVTISDLSQESNAGTNTMIKRALKMVGR